MNRLFFLFSFLFLFQISCKEKVEPFLEMNTKIEDSISIYGIKMETLLQSIIIKTEKNEGLFIQMENAKKVDAISKTMLDYLQSIKDKIKEGNTTEFVNELFFNGSSLTKEAEEFHNYIDHYKTNVVTIINSTNPEITAIINNTFDTGTIEDRRGNKTEWLTLNFKNLPPAASIVKLSSMQSDISRIETKYLSSILKVNLQEEQSIPKVIAKTDETITNDKQDTKPVVTKEVPKKTVKKKVPKKKVVKKPTPKKPKVKKAKYHTVAKGDNIYRISKKYGMTVAQIKKLNGMTNNNIVIGQKLKVN